MHPSGIAQRRRLMSVPQYAERHSRYVSGQSPHWRRGVQVFVPVAVCAPRPMKMARLAPRPVSAWIRSLEGSGREVPPPAIARAVNADPTTSVSTTVRMRTNFFDRPTKGQRRASPGLLDERLASRG